VAAGPPMRSGAGDGRRGRRARPSSRQVRTTRCRAEGRSRSAGAGAVVELLQELQEAPTRGEAELGAAAGAWRCGAGWAAGAGREGAPRLPAVARGWGRRRWRRGTGRAARAQGRSEPQVQASAEAEARSTGAGRRAAGAEAEQGRSRPASAEADAGTPCEKETQKEEEKNADMWTPPLIKKLCCSKIVGEVIYSIYFIIRGLRYREQLSVEDALALINS
jgi:hypothetical protein